MSKYLFDYKELINLLRENETYSDLIKGYDEYCGSDDFSDVSESPFYRGYLSGFDINLKYFAQNFFEDSFNWDLLFRLIFGSFSCSFRLDFSNNWKNNTDEELEAEVIINVYGGAEPEKCLSDLDGHQILTMFQILIAEQIALYVVMQKDNLDLSEKDDIEAQRKIHLKQYKIKENILKERAYFYKLYKKSFPF